MADEPLVGQFRLTKPAYMGTVPGAPARLLPAGTVVQYGRRPNETMEPLDDAAREMMVKHGVKRGELRPEMRLPLNGPGGGEAGAMLRQDTGTDQYDERFGKLEARVKMLEQALLDSGPAKTPEPPEPPKTPKPPKSAAPAAPSAPPAAAAPPPPPPPPAQAA